MGVAVEIHGFAERRIFFASFEEVALSGLERDAVALTDGFDDGARVDAFVDVEGNGGDFEGNVLFLAGPDELRVEVRIVFVGFVRSDGRIGFLSDEADGGLLTRVLPLWSYCSMGRFLDLDSVESFVLVLCPFLGRATKLPRRNMRMLFARDFTRSSP
ncbi:MAG TPA: hypothetical protein VGR03_07175 [Candidatus Acidoferrum sp.]|nr:hypothetical protein [Candidatus Acidoferrum sp.]